MASELAGHSSLVFPVLHSPLFLVLITLSAMANRTNNLFSAAAQAVMLIPLQLPFMGVTELLSEEVRGTQHRPSSRFNLTYRPCNSAFVTVPNTLLNVTPEEHPCAHANGFLCCFLCSPVSGLPGFILFLLIPMRFQLKNHRLLLLTMPLWPRRHRQAWPPMERLHAP